MLQKFIVQTIFALIFSIVCFAPNAFTQTISLNDLLLKADAQTDIYSDIFKNVVAEERKTFEDFDKNGTLKKKRVIESTLLIYQSEKDEKVSTEYRNVVRVDGKPIGDVEKRTTDFFSKLAKSDSVEKELDKINNESSRYDKTISVDGITLNQTPILAEEFSTFFNFKIAGQEKFGERDVVVVEFEQTKECPYIQINKHDKENESLYFEIDIPRSIKEPEARLRGKLWIDSETFQMWREERELTIQPQPKSAPLTILQSTFEYQKTDLSILVPKKITLTNFEIKSKGANVSAFVDSKLTLEYSKFETPNVQVKSGEVDPAKVKPN